MQDASTKLDESIEHISYILAFQICQKDVLTRALSLRAMKWIISLRPINTGANVIKTIFSVTDARIR